MLLGSGLTASEQRAFDVLLKFFEHDPDPERRALALTTPFAARCGYRLMVGGEIDVADIVMEIIVDYYGFDNEVEYLFGERRNHDRNVCVSAHVRR